MTHVMVIIELWVQVTCAQDKQPISGTLHVKPFILELPYKTTIFLHLSAHAGNRLGKDSLEGVFAIFHIATTPWPLQA